MLAAATGFKMDQRNSIICMIIVIIGQCDECMGSEYPLTWFWGKIIGQVWHRCRSIIWLHSNLSFGFRQCRYFKMLEKQASFVQNQKPIQTWNLNWDNLLPNHLLITVIIVHFSWWSRLLLFHHLLCLCSQGITFFQNLHYPCYHETDDQMSPSYQKMYYKIRKYHE